jgi:vacuolar protein sorting-associated protein 11
LGEWPDETTDLFITYYGGKYVPVKEQELVKAVSPPPSISGALSSFRDAADITKYVQYLPYMTDKPRSGVTSPPSSGRNVQPSTKATTTSAVAETTAPTPQYHPPRPRAAFSIFVDYPTCFIRFLESMMEDDGFAQREKRDIDDICTTLFEAYLREARSGKEERAMWEEKAKSLLTDQKVQSNDYRLIASYLSTLLFCCHISRHLGRVLVLSGNVHPSRLTFSDHIRQKEIQ